MAGSGDAHLREAESALLRVEDMVVEFPFGRTGKKVHAVSDVSLDALPGETLGLVGESGCGKSTTGKAMMQLPKPTSGHVYYNGSDLTELSGAPLRRVRPEMQMIFQDPISSLNPRRKVGDIVAEPMRIWASEQNPPSGPVALATRFLKGDFLLGWAAYAVVLFFWFVDALIPYLFNRETEDATTGEMVTDEFFGGWEFFSPTGGTFLVNALIFGAAAYGLSTLVRDRVPSARPLLAALTAVYAVLFGLAVSGVGTTMSIAVWGAGLALTGIALVLTLLPPAAEDFRGMAGVRQQQTQRVRKVLEDVGLDPDQAIPKRPHEFSGGQCQRICIARSLVLDPQVIICDEPVSALDVSVQAQILNLLEEMKARYDLTLVFIAHDLAVVKNVSDRVAVMYLGKLCEVSPPDTLYDAPAHPYTAALLASIPVPDPAMRVDEENVLGGELPSPVDPPSGCRFRTRCPRAEDICAQVEPEMRMIGPEHYVACHFPLQGEPSRTQDAELAASES